MKKVVNTSLRSVLELIVKNRFEYIATLKKQYSDDLDFPEVSIWGLEEILEQAYMLGRDDAKNDIECKK